MTSTYGELARRSRTELLPLIESYAERSRGPSKEDAIRLVLAQPEPQP